MSKKAELLEAVAGKNRGLLGNEIDRVKVLSLVEQLEDENPTPNPIAATDLLEGDWRLLFTTSRSLLGLDRFPLLQLGQIYQCVRPASAKVYNIAEIIGLPFLESIVSVAARFDPVSERRVDVKFERSIVGLKSLLNYRSPADLIRKIEAGTKFPAIDFNIENQDQQGWLEITYLDADLRLGRGNQGNVFVLAREKE